MRWMIPVLSLVWVALAAGGCAEILAVSAGLATAAITKSPEAGAAVGLAVEAGGIALRERQQMAERAVGVTDCMRFEQYSGGRIIADDLRCYSKMRRADFRGDPLPTAPNIPAVRNEPPMVVQRPYEEPPRAVPHSPSPPTPPQSWAPSDRSSLAPMVSWARTQLLFYNSGTQPVVVALSGREPLTIYPQMGRLLVLPPSPYPIEARVTSAYQTYSVWVQPWQGGTVWLTD